MENWKQVCELLTKEGISLQDVKTQLANNFKKYQAYPDSLHHLDGSFFFLAWVNEVKKLVVYKESGIYLQFQGFEEMCNQHKVKLCDLNNENCKIIRRIFPFTNPSSHQNFDITIGLGDRLGLASAGHLRLLKGKKVFPVLAQQSIRELNLTGRTYDDVLAAASWAVFQEGYTSGFGADGDHLKTSAEVKMAIGCGVTMITLDCSEHINNNIISLSAPEIDQLYLTISDKDRQKLETKYLMKNLKLKDGSTITFSVSEFRKIVLIYLKAINYTIDIYHSDIKNCGRHIDFEMSIDETLTSTSPESHYFVASELLDGGVEITSLAPRFCGEFQKGIDYRGDIHNFTQEFNVHVKIAQNFSYKISIHSGSDKFSVFPIIGEKTGGHYHLKTAGTNWLEAVRVIAVKDPSLYRRMHKFAIQHLDEAKKYYHISANVSNIPDIEKLKDSELPSLMNMDDSRQVIHITYGLILLAKNPDGSSMFRR